MITFDYKKRGRFDPSSLILLFKVYLKAQNVDMLNKFLEKNK